MIEMVSDFFSRMPDLFLSFFSFHWRTFLKYLFKIGASCLLAIPLALEREYFSRSLGLRTFPLVAVASCGYVLVAESFIGDNPDAKARIMQGLMTGVGFIGGGAILKRNENVIGAATAVSLWSTGTVGAAVAHDRYEIAILVAFVNFLALRVLSPLKDGMEKAGLHEDRETFPDAGDEDGGAKEEEDAASSGSRE
jgi:putative Mg2+ transporter-C (MgtC) family protein